MEPLLMVLADGWLHITVALFIGAGLCAWRAVHIVRTARRSVPGRHRERTEYARGRAPVPRRGPECD